MRYRVAIFFASLLTLCLLATGCGGSGGGSIDKAAFVEQANAICQQATTKIRTGIATVLGKTSNSNQDKTNLVLMRGTVIPGFQAELEEIRALGIPSEGKPEAQAFLRAQQKAIKTVEADPTTFFGEKGPFKTAELAGTKYGLSECPIAAVPAS